MPSGQAKNIIRLLTPLTIQPEILEEGLDILEHACSNGTATDASHCWSIGEKS
jgi:4-aminobutyrate aminotransferase-like enzyme